MRLFSRLYDLALRWSRHRHAERYLAGLSFAESSFFPVPPDVMLAPMALADRARAWRYAWVTTVASVLGGLLGYTIGALAFQAVEPWLHRVGYWDNFLIVRDWFARWGFWAVFLAGFTPIPYKLFTIAAGVVSMALLPFALASFIGRGGRFFLVAGIIVLGGERMERMLRTYIDVIGWLLVAALVAAYLIWG
ncbi:MAG TPA: YqaA family protein [Acidiferrobacterales bacterium]